MEKPNSLLLFPENPQDYINFFPIPYREFYPWFAGSLITIGKHLWLQHDLDVRKPFFDLDLTLSLLTKAALEESIRTGNPPKWDVKKLSDVEDFGYAKAMRMFQRWAR